MKIRILEKCRAADQHLPLGAVLAVPDEIPEAVARQLVRMRRAVEVIDEEPGDDALVDPDEGSGDDAVLDGIELP
jgi:hypothetical protein